jgi:hypothetical protein
MDNKSKTAPIAIQHRIYRPRRPEDSAYYQCVEDHFEDFEQVYEERFERAVGLSQ